MNTRKAFVDQILLWFIIAVLVFGFVATVSDDNNARVKYQNLKRITDHAALAAAYYYSENFSTVIDDETGKTESAQKATYIVKNDTSKLANEVPIIYTWDFSSTPYRVTATITTHTHENFWWKLFNWKEYVFTNVNSTAIIAAKLTGDNFVPIAVNDCTQTFPEGSTFEYILKANDIYSDTDNVGFFALELPGGGQSSFSHFKNLLDLVIDDKDSDFDVTDSDLVISPVNAIDINNDVKQVSQSFDIADFTGKEMSIALLECGSTAANPIISKLLRVDMQNVRCAVCYEDPLNPGNCLSPDGDHFLQLSNTDGSVFDDIIWSNTVNSCNNEELFKIEFQVLISDYIRLEN